MPNGYDPAQFGITGMSPGYLQSLMEDIRRRGRQTYGEVTARGTRAGMEYDEPTMGIRQQAAISGTQMEMGRTVGGFAYQSEQERQQRLEREKDRQLQLQLARMGRGGGGYRPPIQYGRVPSIQPTALAPTGPGAGMGEAVGGPGAPTPAAPGWTGVQRAVEQAYQPPAPPKWPGAPTKGPFQRQTRYGY